MPCVDFTTSSLMTPLMSSNVLSIGPLEEGGAEDDEGGLKAGVAPSMTWHRTQVPSWLYPHLSTWDCSLSTVCAFYRAPPSSEPDSRGPHPRKSLAAVDDLVTSYRTWWVPCNTRPKSSVGLPGWTAYGSKSWIPSFFRTSSSTRNWPV